MPSFEHVHNLMVEVGDLMDLPQVSEYAEERAWLLVTPAGPSIEVDYDEAGDRVLLAVAVGAPDRAGVGALHEELLLHNGRLPDPGGARAGLEEPEGEVVLMLECAAAGLDAPRLRTLVEELAEAAAPWRERLRDPSGGPSGGPSGDGSPTGGLFRPDTITIRG